MFHKPTIRAASKADLAEREDAALSGHAPRKMEYLTLLEAIDAAIARRQGGDASVHAAQVYATVWAVIGYGLWLAFELMFRVAALLIRWIASLFGRDQHQDDGWTTTMKRKGRVR
jgi:hypothetical protein